MIRNLLITALLLLVSGQAVSDGLQKAVDAIDTGAYKSAQQQLLPLAKKGNRDAQTLLGLLYSEGRGTPVDTERARHWFLQAANQGQADAAFLLGLSYLHKNSTDDDNAKAVHWVKYAARHDNLLAQRFMALAYEKGWMNIEVSEWKSRYWWKRYEELKMAGNSHQEKQ